MKNRFNKIFSIFLGVSILFQTCATPVMAFQNNNPNSLKIINNENTKQENKQSKTIIGTNDLNSSSKTNSLYNVDINNLGSKNLTLKQIEAAKALSPGQSLIFKYPKINYEVGERLDLSSIEILIKNFNNEIRLLKYDDISKNEKIDINLKHGDIIYENYYNSLFNEKFLEKETNHTKKSIIQYLEKNKINPYIHSIAIKIPNFSPINIKLNIKDSNLNLSPLDLFRALKMKNSSMILLEADKLAYKVDEEINLEKFKFLVKKETGFLNIINGKDIKSESINVDLTKIDKDKKNFAKDKNSPYIYTYITLSKKGFKNLYIPITLIRNDIEKNQINNKNFDILSWGLNLDKSNSIYTLTLDVKNLSDVKEAKFKFLNSITKTAQNIKIDRIVKTNGFEEEDITLTNPLYRDEDNIEDYKDFSSKKMKEKLEKLEVKNPVKLSNSLETGYKYVFFIKKEADNKDNLLLDLETKTNDENPLKKEVEIEAKFPKIANILNKFIALKDSENTPKAEEKAKVYGKFMIKKTDEKQNFLSGSEFTLSKKEGEKLPKSFENIIKKVEKAEGIIFENLESGLYILKETKSPDGYKASDDYVVIVHASGNTQVIDKKLFDIMDKSELKEEGDPDELLNTKSTIDVEGTGSTKRDPNIFDGQLIKKLDVSDYELVSSNDKHPTTVYPNNGEYLKAKFKVKLPAQAKEGDYFYITYDDNINRLGNKMLEDKLLPIKSYLGEELITVSNKNGDNTYKYILTKAVNNKQDFEIEIETPLYVNREKIRDNSLLKITNRIPSKGKDNDSAKTVEEKVFESQISVDYSNFSQKSKTSNDYIGSAIYYNTDKVELDQTTGRPKLDEQGKPIEKTSPNPYTISYVYVYGEKLPQDIIKVGLYGTTGNISNPYIYSSIDLTNAEISVYKVKQPFDSLLSTDKLNPNSMPESFGLTEASLNSETKLNLNNDYSVESRNAKYGLAKVLTINGDNKGDDSVQYGYIIKVKAPYQIGDVPIRLVATMSRNSNFVGFENEIIQAKPSATINYSKAIKLVKKDSDNSKLIDGAIFKLTSVEGEEKYLQYAKTGKDSQNQNNNGTLYFTKIKAGDYILEEVLAPKGYQKPSSPWKVKITVDHKGDITGVTKQSGIDDLLTVSNGSNNEITVKNKKAPIISTQKTVINYPNKIKFYKVDENGESLKGAKFKLVSGTETVRELKSIDQNKINEFIFEKLSSGDYKLLEIQAPEGYPSVGNGLEVATFSVNARGEIENVKTYNGVALTDSDGSVHKIVNSKYKPVYPSTGGIGTFPFIGIGLSLIAIAYIELKRNKKYIILN
ncbi:SpaA isopeptide-forming pilin-related protein [Helcococcus ovis]|uniref:SpaA isopeptide-forming pilin-related protein n=1 Tax=Helcococcus ovis TaxID=72026 RepID=UPI0038BE0578